MVPIEIRDSIPDFKTFRVWNATRKCWSTKRYTRKGDAINLLHRRDNDPTVYVLVTTSSCEVQYELI